MNRKALGKGLNALIPDFELGVPKDKQTNIQEILVHETTPNRNQPRKHFDDEKLFELVESIREKGVIQPIVVQKTGSGFEIIVGERRWRAAQKAGLKKIPAVVKEASDKESLELAIIENIHRQDLNPIEEARAYSRLSGDFGLKQEQIAKQVGKSRASIANYIRLLRLSKNVQDEIESSRLTMGHARALLALNSDKEIESLSHKIIANGWNVRQAEAFVKNSAKSKRASIKKATGKKNIFLKNLESEFERGLGTKVEISPGKKGGKLVISYYSDDDLERIRELLVSKIS